MPQSSLTMRALLLIPLALVEQDVTNEFVVNLPFGGQVELIAVGNPVGLWWRPDGTIIPSPEFGVPDRLYEIHQQSTPTLDRYYFVLRSSDVDDSKRVRFHPGARIPGKGVGTGTSNFDVTDKSGKRLTGWTGCNTSFGPPLTPDSVLEISVSTEFGEWREMAKVAPEIVSENAVFDLGTYVSKDDLVHFWIKPDSSTTIKRHFSYTADTAPRQNVIRAVVLSTTHEPEILESRSHMSDKSIFRFADVKPIERDASSFEAVVFEARDRTSQLITGIPFYRAGDIESREDVGRDQRSLIVTAIAGVLAMLLLAGLAILGSRGKSEPITE